MKKFKFTKKEWDMTPEQIKRKLNHLSMNLTDDLIGITEKIVADYGNMRRVRDADAVIKHAKGMINYYNHLIKNAREMKEWLRFVERVDRLKKK